MPKCKENCRPQELFTAFMKTGTGCRIDADHLMPAANDFCSYTARHNKPLCDINLADLTGFIKLLNSLESQVFTADDIHREIHIINLFYDYLQATGCVADNPVQRLKQQEIEQLLQKLSDRRINTKQHMPEV